MKRTVIPNLIDPTSSSVAHTPANKAGALNSFCRQSVLHGADSAMPDRNSLPQNSGSLDSLHTTPREVYDVLSSLNEGKAPGLLSPCGAKARASLDINPAFQFKLVFLQVISLKLVL